MAVLSVHRALYRMSLMSKLLCMLAAIAVLTNSVVWSADAVAHLGDHAAGGLAVADMGHEQSASSPDDVPDHGEDNHHCCHQLSHLSGLGVAAGTAVLAGRAGTHERLTDFPADGFFRSPLRPPSV